MIIKGFKIKTTEKTEKILQADKEELKKLEEDYEWWYGLKMPAYMYLKYLIAKADQRAVNGIEDL